MRPPGEGCSREDGGVHGLECVLDVDSTGLVHDSKSARGGPERKGGI